MPSNFTRRSQRKKQTRLAFDPVEPGSISNMSPARLRYNIPSSPDKAFDLTSPAHRSDGAEQDLFPSGKKYAVVVETPKRQKKDGKLPFKHLATPAESSQIRNSKSGQLISDGSDSDLEINPTSRRQRGNRSEKPDSRRGTFLSSGGSRPLAGIHRILSSHKKQYPIWYDGAEDDSSVGSPPEEGENSTRRKLKLATPRKKPTIPQSSAAKDEDSEIESPLESPSRASVVNGLAVLPSRKSPPDTDIPKTADMRSLISGGSVNFSQKSKRTPHKRNSKGTKNPVPTSRVRRRKDSNTRSDDEDAIAILPSSQQTGQNRTTKRQIIISDDSEDSEEAPQTSQTRSGRGSSRMNEGASENKEDPPSRIEHPKSLNKATLFALKGDDREEEDAIVQSSPRRRLRKPVEERNREHDTDDDDEDPISSPLKRRRVVISEDDAESDPFTSPSKRFRPGLIGQNSVNNNTSRKPTRLTRQQQQQQKKPHRSAREKKLELLRRQRAGEKIVELTSSESDESQQQMGIYDSNSDLEVLSEFEDEEKDENEGIEEVRRSLLSSNQNNDDDDFVVDDDNDPLGIPELGLNDIPLQFTHHAHKPLKEHFKDAVEWMIQNKINPAFNRKDPIYIQAFRKLDIEVQGYASSIYSSTVWREAFTRALWARPVFSERVLTLGDDQEGNKCDACGRTNHPAKFEVQFSGRAYYKETLDEVDNDHVEEQEEDDDDSRSVTSVNSSGQSIPGADVSWFVGRFCKANAQTAHSLIHWKHALNDWVTDRLKSDGHLEGPKLAEREDWSTSKRSKFANRIVDEWEAEEEIKALYRDFKINLDLARQGKATRWGKA